MSIEHSGGLERENNKYEGDRWTLESRVTEGAAAAEALEKRLSEAGWTEDEIGTFDYAIDEAITNAIIHGNLAIEWEPDESKESYEARILAAQESALNNKNITVEITLSNHDVVVVVEDEAKKVIDSKHIPDPTSPEGLLKTSGRGIRGIIDSCDEVDFSIPGKVTMRKLKRTGDEIS